MGKLKKSPIQSFQNIALRKIINSPPSILNHTDLKFKMNYEEAKYLHKRFHDSLTSHPNILIKYLASVTIPDSPSRRLKRKWCRDLLQD